jgi:hypothetical protein
MLNKTLIALSAIALLGSATLASGGEAPEDKLGDRYPFLEKPYTPAAGNAVRSRSSSWQFTAANQSAPEDKLGDRFAFLAGGYAPTAAPTNVRWNTAQTVRTQGGYEAPENKIADRYPFLEQTFAQRGGATGIVTVRMHRNGRGA